MEPFGDREGQLIIGLPLTDLPVYDQVVLVGGHKEFLSDLHVRMKLSFVDPFGIGLENRKNFFTVWDRFFFDQPSFH